MHRLSAADAVNPAWTYSWSLLVAPRQWRTLLKVGTVAVFASMGGCNGSFNSSDHTGPIPHLSHLSPVLLLAVAATLALVVGLVMFYVGSRLRFVLFDIMLRRETLVAPIWRRYAQQTWRWIGLKLILVLFLMACIVPVAVPVVLQFRHMARLGQAMPRAEVAGMIVSVGLSVLALILIILLSVVLFSLVYDFALPFIAVENYPAWEAVKQVFALVRAEPGQFAVYLLTRFLLGFAGSIVAYLGIAVGGLLLALPLGAAGYGLWSGLHAAGAVAQVFMIAAMALLAVVLLVPVVAAFLMIFGFLLCFIQAYTLFFLGGRYPAVGQILAPTFIPPPPPPGWMPIPPPLTSYTG